MRRTLTQFLLGCGVLLVLSLVAAHGLGTTEQPRLCAIAAGLCIPPALFTLALVELCPRHPPELRPLVALGGVALRMTVVLTASWLIVNVLQHVDEGHTLAFWGWVILFYLFTLSWEVTLVVRSQRRALAPSESVVSRS